MKWDSEYLSLGLFQDNGVADFLVCSGVIRVINKVSGCHDGAIIYTVISKVEQRNPCRCRE